MSDAIQRVAPPRDTEAGVRESDRMASVAIDRDLDLVPNNPSDYDNPGRYDESRYGYARYGDE